MHRKTGFALLQGMALLQRTQQRRLGVSIHESLLQNLLPMFDGMLEHAAFREGMMHAQTGSRYCARTINMCILQLTRMPHETQCSDAEQLTQLNSMLIRSCNCRAAWTFTIGTLCMVVSFMMVKSM